MFVCERCKNEDIRGKATRYLQRSSTGTRIYDNIDIRKLTYDIDISSMMIYTCLNHNFLPMLLINTILGVMVTILVLFIFPSANLTCIPNLKHLQRAISTYDISTPPTMTRHHVMNSSPRLGLVEYL